MKQNLLTSFLLFSSLLLILISCQSVKKEFGTQSKKVDGDFIENVKNLEIDNLNQNQLSKIEKEFIEIVQEILNCEFGKVESRIKRIISNEENNPFKYEYLKFLTYSLFFQSKWNELLPTASYYYDPDSVFLLAKVFSKVEPQELRFEKDVDTIGFSLAPNGAIIVQVIINGRQRNFWFDTGTNYTIVSSKTAEDCNLPILTKVKSKAITHSDYRVDVLPTYIEELKLGSMKIMNHPCLIVDDFNLKLQLIATKVPFEIYGIIGWKAIQNAKFTINYDNSFIIVEKPKKNQNRGNNFFWFGVPIVIGQIFDTKVLFALDLGSERSYLTYNVFNKINFPKVYEQTKKIGSVGGWKYNPSVVVPYFEFFINKFKISFSDIPTINLAKDYFFRIDGILGLDFAKRAIISFDISNSKFEITKY
ncbi:MAG: retroviral-like aspartic protease family protein [Ignavibacteria bacterium]|nr:retroviral-like aspartic protease family protein [Ignavibacteria bacterium]